MGLVNNLIYYNNNQFFCFLNLYERMTKLNSIADIFRFSFFLLKIKKEEFNMETHTKNINYNFSKTYIVLVEQSAFSFDIIVETFFIAFSKLCVLYSSSVSFLLFFI